MSATGFIPTTWTYRRQAWSLLGRERVGGEYGQFVQAPIKGEESEWAFLIGLHV